MPTISEGYFICGKCGKELPMSNFSQAVCVGIDDTHDEVYTEGLCNMCIGDIDIDGGDR